MTTRSDLRILMIVPALLEFGGLEKIAVNLACALRAQGVHVALVSTRWAPADNQYRRRLAQAGIPYGQPTGWLYHLAADWSAKERAVARLVWLLTPLAVAMAAALSIVRRQPLKRSLASARGWLSQQIMRRWVGPNRHQTVVRWLLAWWHWRWRPNVLHLHGYLSALLFVLNWAHARGLPTLYAENQTPDSQFDWWQGFAGALQKANVVLAASDISAAALRDICGVTRPLATFMPIVPDPGPMPLRTLAPGQPLQLTTVARLYVTKGLNYLLEALAAVRQRLPNTRLRIYGDGPLRDDLWRQAHALGLDPADIFAGTFTEADLPAIMAETDLFVSSSVLEGLPLAIVEAMSYGRPIVATAAGGVPEALQDGVSGIVCPTHSVDCLVQSILRLAGDDALRRQYAAGARQAYTSGRFHPDTVARQLTALYETARAEGPVRL